MKINFIPIVSIMIFLVASCSPEIHGKKASEDRQLKVLAYNIHHANPPSKPDVIDIEAIASVILESEAELVALQEVDVRTERSGKDLHQAAKLAELTGMHYYFSKSIDYQGGEYGNAILSKYPIENSEVLPLPAEEGTEPRMLLVAEVNLPNGETIKFASTHLDYTSKTIAHKQAEAITSFFEKERLPVVMGGDFNSVPGSDAINHLDGFFKRSCQEDCPPTIPVINPNREIDFIMFSPKDHFRVITHRTIGETYASDHLPLMAEMSW
ncbi:MAG: endonuclease/exonuclease/phosphatase family protein [Cyclobacteriaceae bacterium]